MSTLFSTIRSLSFQNDEIQRKKLSHTLSFHFHDDDSNWKQSQVQYEDPSTLSRSLKPIQRNTFDKKRHNIEPNSKEGKANPISLIHDLLSTSFRTHCTKPLDIIVETISIALKDTCKESYGRQSGITTKDIHNLTFSCSNLSFNPNTCTWIGQVDYDCNVFVKTQSNTEKELLSPYQGNFVISVSCQTVLVHLNTIHHEKDKIKPHYCIEVEAIMKKNFDPKTIDRNVLKIISQTVIHVGYDITRALSWLDLPEFPEGCKETTFRTVYQLNAKIKSGSFATVCLGTHRATKKQIAVKCVQRKKLPPSDDVTIHSEVNLLCSLRHEYICPIIDYFIEEEGYFIVMELMEGGDVFDRVGKLDHYDESIARDLCKKMLKAIAYCHEQNIAHCDLKTKNLLLRTVDDHDSVMLADFGFSTTVFAPKTLKKQCGTPYFVAPEILLRQGYDQQADMWSVGVIIYCLLSGSLPFTGKRHLDLFKAIIAGNFDFDEHWEDVSDDAKDLICKLLVTNPDKRYTASEALNSKWIRASDTSLKSNSLYHASSRMRTFNARLKFKSSILLCQSLARWKNLTKHTKEGKQQNNHDRSEI